jgi:hypothetical protein
MNALSSLFAFQEQTARICFRVATGYNFSNQRSSSFLNARASVALEIMQTVLAFLLS